KTLIDNGFHIAVTDLREGGTLEELATLPDQGITSYKLFMAYKGALMVDDETLFRTMQVAADTGALVMVHAENGDAIDVLVKAALAAGHTDPKYHALTRPPETEGEATNRAIQLARVAGSPLYVVHVSCAESVEPIQIAREKGWNVHGETCTQYFFVDYSFLERPNFEGAKYLYPRKGTIAVGSDADVVVFDPEKRHTITAATQHSKTDYNLYEGTEVTGSPEVVLLRGHVLVERDELVARPGIGQFVARARFGEELKPAAAGAPA